MSKSNIEWTDYTWNPIVGCSKVSDGCANCYAEKMANRSSQIFNPTNNDELFSDYISIVNNYGKFNGKTAFVESALEKPLKWKKPRKIFVCSMGDLFHESVPFEWIHKVWDIMKACPQHLFLVLTKRPENMKECVDRIYSLERLGWAKGFWEHLWLGVTAENQVMADRRIPVLLQIPAAKRFVSIEPMLGDVDIRRYMLSDYDKAAHDNQMTGFERQDNKLDWVICGAETGHNARPCDIQWVRDLQDDCEQWNRPFFFKKFVNGETKIDGKEYREYPEGEQ